ncbi:MAG: hypothetical protein QOE99_1001 [Actinomycetota bacterium]|jgi:hypothetical protein|nr:hypothetical protein [Actinomycetota bacterium]
MDRYAHWAFPPRSALRNAREALTAISASVADRLALTAVLADDEGEPGALSAMTAAECHEQLAAGVLGRLAYIARADTPDIVPVNYVMDGVDILIRSGPGPKLQAAERGARVAFEVDAVDSATRTGRSVVVIGRATRLRPAEQRQHEDGPAPWASGPRDAVIRIRPTRVTGRRLS